MDCPDCFTASQALHHGFTAGCRGCCARAAARSPQYNEAKKQGRQGKSYRALLEHFSLTHAEVREADESDMLGKEPA